MLKDFFRKICCCHQWLEVGKEYECVEGYNKVHILGIGMVVSKEIFNEHFEIKKEQ